MREAAIFLALLACVTVNALAQNGWTVQSANTSSLVRSVKSVNSNLGWMCADDATIRRTTDGGTTWNVIPSPVPYPLSIAATDSLNAIISAFGVNGEIYHTSDGGTTWAQVFTQTNGFIVALLMVSRSVGYALGIPVNGKWTILQTTTGGKTWEHFLNEPSQIGDESGWTQSFFTIGGRYFWFGASYARVYHSSDSGASWTSSVSSAHSGVCTAVSFADSLNGVAAFGSGGGVAFSSDGGTTWNPATIPATGFVWGIATDHVNRFWLPTPNAVFVSTDLGRNWADQFSNPFGGHLRDINFSLDGSTISGWLGSSTGGIAKYTGSLTSVDRGVSGAPNELRLEQNYPNPFNPLTTISYSLPYSTHVTLAIYNMLGQQVAVLINERKNAGTYQQTWNAGDMPSGVYFYRLQAGGFVATKKLVLVK